MDMCLKLALLLNDVNEIKLYALHNSTTAGVFFWPKNLHTFRCQFIKTLKILIKDINEKIVCCKKRHNIAKSLN